MDSAGASHRRGQGGVTLKPGRRNIVAVAVAGTWMVVAGAVVAWLSFSHLRGSLAITRGGTTETLTAHDCSGGTAKRPFVSGMKLFLSGGYELLISGVKRDGSFVVLRTPQPNRTALVIKPAQCATFETQMNQYTPRLIHKFEQQMDGSATLDCTLPDGSIVRGTLGFQQCVKSNVMVGETD